MDRRRGRRPSDRRPGQARPGRPGHRARDHRTSRAPGRFRRPVRHLPRRGLQAPRFRDRPLRRTLQGRSGIRSGPALSHRGVPRRLRRRDKETLVVEGVPRPVPGIPRPCLRAAPFLGPGHRGRSEPVRPRREEEAGPRLRPGKRGGEVCTLRVRRRQAVRGRQGRLTPFRWFVAG